MNYKIKWQEDMILVLGPGWFYNSLVSRRFVVI